MAPFTDYFGLSGNYLGSDGIDNGVVKMALTTVAEKAISNQINNNQPIGGYPDVIDVPTETEMGAMNDAFTRMESSGRMLEKGFAVGYNPNGEQGIRTAPATATGQVSIGAARAALVGDGYTDISYDAHSHGAVIKENTSAGTFEVGGKNSSPTDRIGPVNKQPNIVLGYDVQDNQGRLPLAIIIMPNNRLINGFL